MYFTLTIMQFSSLHVYDPLENKSMTLIDLEKKYNP